MEKQLTCFLNERMDRALQKLQRQNKEYRLALQKSNALYEELVGLLYPKETTAELEQLREKLKAYSDEDIVIQAAIQETFYKAGYKDCVKLLQLLGVLPEIHLRA